jgi:hypothetical protein
MDGGAVVVLMASRDAIRARPLEKQRAKAAQRFWFEQRLVLLPQGTKQQRFEPSTLNRRLQT